MKYRCIVCDLEFEVAEGEKPRCPSCLKVHDIESVGVQSKSKPTKRGWIAPAIVISIACVLIAVFFAVRWSKPRPDTEVKAKDLSSKVAELGVTGEKGVIPFETTDRVKRFAEEASAGKSGIDAMRSIFDAIAAKRNNKLWKPHPQQEPRKTKPITADEFLSTMEGVKDKPFEALSYETACLLLAAARGVGLDAKMSEIYRFENEKTPADNGGKLGRYGVALGSGEAGKSPPLFDPFSGRFMESAKGEMRILSDKEATAPYYGIGAMSLLAQRDAGGALKLNNLAMELAPESAYPNIGRGLIFAASGAPGEAIAELEKAVKKSDDAVTRTALAEMLLLTDPTGKKAEAEALAALSSMPDYARTHLIMATVHMFRMEMDQAQAEIATAERSEPNSPQVAMFWAQYYAVNSRSEEAIEKAKEAVRLSGESVTSLMTLASIYRATSRFDEMRETLDKIVKTADFPGISKEIEALFGYNPDAPKETGDAGAKADPSQLGEKDEGVGNLELKLGGDKLGAGSGGSGMGLGGGKLKPPGGGLSGQNLQLDLDLNNK